MPLIRPTPLSSGHTGTMSLTSFNKAVTFPKSSLSYQGQNYSNIEQRKSRGNRFRFEFEGYSYRESTAIIQVECFKLILQCM